MKVPISFLACIFFSVIAVAQGKVFPVIKQYGQVEDVPYAAMKPNTRTDYKIVVEAGERISDKAAIYDPLDMVARMYNLHAYGGVPAKKIHISFVLFAGGAAAALSDEEYNKRFGMNNPNTGIIAALKEAGVELIICAQSMAKQKISPELINEKFITATSRITAVTSLQQKGYKLYQL